MTFGPSDRLLKGSELFQIAQGNGAKKHPGQFRTCPVQGIPSQVNGQGVMEAPGFARS